MLKRFGVKVHKQKNLRLHAKLLIADECHALVGSMNIDRSAFDLRRELGTTVKEEAVVKRLMEVFDGGLGPFPRDTMRRIHSIPRSTRRPTFRTTTS